MRSVVSCRRKVLKGTLGPSPPKSLWRSKKRPCLVKIHPQRRARCQGTSPNLSYYKTAGREEVYFRRPGVNVRSLWPPRSMTKSREFMVTKGSGAFSASKKVNLNNRIEHFWSSPIKAGFIPYIVRREFYGPKLPLTNTTKTAAYLYKS